MFFLKIIIIVIRDGLTTAALDFDVHTVLHFVDEALHVLLRSYLILSWRLLYALCCHDHLGTLLVGLTLTLLRRRYLVLTTLDRALCQCYANDASGTAEADLSTLCCFIVIIFNDIMDERLYMRMRSTLIFSNFLIDNWCKFGILHFFVGRLLFTVSYRLSFRSLNGLHPLVSRLRSRVAYC